ncbi:regulatory LuxR family protein [Streptomyces sp. 846.5]|nr:LuxR family transcriptional regulator [Streptomyces sp. 846.5]TDU03336.1 regulatory LuxR family protein [Streptomyces sp. 846.5]
MSKQSQQQPEARPARSSSSATAPRPLTGREHEMSVLRSAVTACADGASTVIEITGDPGLGKSRLLAELGDLARAEGLTVLSGRASEFEQQRSFGAFADPVRWCVGRLAERRHETLDEETAALLDLMLPRTAGSRAGQPQSPGVERYRLHHAFGRLLADADRGRGVLLCLDDLHWADDGTVELLHHLLRQPPQAALILACGHRPRQAPAKLLASFHHATADYRTALLPLSPLDRQSCESLLGTVHTPAQREQLATVSGGNPLYLEVLSELTTEGATGFTDLPDTLRAALAREIALLTTDELAVLRAAAVLGDPFDPMLLAPISGLAAGPALEALDVLAETDLIRSCPPTGPRPDIRQLLQFRHPLLREVVSRDTPPGWRLAANARADEALRRSGASAVERAPYIARAAHVGDTAAVRVLAEAAKLTVHSAPATAAAWLRAALYLSVPDGSEESTLDRHGMLLGLANACGLTGDLAACRDALGQALDLVPPDRPDRRIPIVVLRSAVERTIGSVKVSGTVLEDELTLWPTTDARANPLRLQLATTLMGQGRFEEADRLLDALLARTPAPVDRSTLTSVAACRALGAAYSGRTAPLRAYASEAAAAIDLMEDEELATFLEEVGQLGWAEVLAERHHDAIRHMARGIRTAGATGQSYMMPYLLLCQSYAQQASGDLAGGIASAAGAEEMAHLLDRPDLIGYALTLRAAAIALRDSPAAAVEAAERAVHAVGRRGRLWELSTAVLASVRLDQGRPDDCIELLRSITGTDRSETTHALRAMWYCTAAQAEMARGDVVAARDWAKHATGAAEAVGLPGQQGHAALATACVQDDPVAAADLFSTAADSFAASGLAPAEARARLLLGRALAAAGRTDEAVTAIGRAKQIADTHGSAHLGALAVNAQRQLGARRPRPARSVDATDRTLSEQERHISGMVARGLSNRDIAASLFVSVKTVEGHLTRIFRKLDVSSRSALISVLAQLPDAP